MRDLLERWAAAGERTTAFNGTASRILPPVLGDQWSIAHSNQLFRIRAESLACRAHILAATIEAIEARGFMPWRLHRDADGCAADVTRYPHGFAHTVYGPDKSDSPAEALLAAYLAAVEAEGAS